MGFFFKKKLSSIICHEEQFCKMQKGLKRSLRRPSHLSSLGWSAGPAAELCGSVQRAGVNVTGQL